VNVQRAADTASRGPHGQVFVRGVGSRAIVGVEVSNEGSGSAGLSETRPSMRAVWSPSREAIQACAHSCTLSEKRIRTNSKTAMRKALDCKRNFHWLESSG
jgi:hypothetical protein